MKRRDAAAGELRQVADDLKALLAAITTDPGRQARLERRWRLLYAASSAVFSVVAQKAAAKIWAVLTGVPPPTKASPQAAPAAPAPQPGARAEPERVTA